MRLNLLGIAFIAMLVMKIANISPVGRWSWWAVTAPLWGPVAILLFVVFLEKNGVLGNKKDA